MLQSGLYGFSMLYSSVIKFSRDLSDIIYVNHGGAVYHDTFRKIMFQLRFLYS